MQPAGEVVGWGGEDRILLSSFEDEGAWEVGEVLCLMALASCINNGRALNALYWDIRSAGRAEAEVTKIKTKSKTVIPKSPFN